MYFLNIIYIIKNNLQNDFAVQKITFDKYTYNSLIVIADNIKYYELMNVRAFFVRSNHNLLINYA